MGQFPSVRLDLAHTSNTVLNTFGCQEVASKLRVGGKQLLVGFDLPGQVKGNANGFSKERQLVEGLAIIICQ